MTEMPESCFGADFVSLLLPCAEVAGFRMDGTQFLAEYLEEL